MLSAQMPLGARSCLSANISPFKVDNRNSRKSFDICSKLTKKYLGDVIDVVLVSSLLISSAFTADFKQSDICWKSFRYKVSGDLQA